MFGIGKKLLAVAGVLTAMAALPGTAAANCSCMCVDGAPDYVCTIPGFGSSGATPDCSSLQCDAPPPADPEPPADEPPVADGGDAVTPPEPGLVCKRRSIYRPDLGKYKSYKVCHPRLSEEQIARIEAIKERIKKRIAKRRARAAKYASRNGKRTGYWRWRS